MVKEGVTEADWPVTWATGAGTCANRLTRLTAQSVSAGREAWSSSTDGPPEAANTTLR